MPREDVTARKADHILSTVCRTCSSAYVSFAWGHNFAFTYLMTLKTETLLVFKIIMLCSCKVKRNIT